jgi:IS1 family transposase
VYRAIDQFGQVIDVFVSARRDAKAARRFLQRAIGTMRVAPVEVVTDHARLYPAVLEELLPAAWHRTDRYANNHIEGDHGRLKARLRPMRGLKQDRSARIVIAGHAFVQNVRRGHDELAVEEPVNRRVAVAVDELALAICSRAQVAASAPLGWRNATAPLDIVAGEGADHVSRVPQRQGDELGPVALVAPNGAQVPWGKVVIDGLPVVPTRRLPSMLGVLPAVPGPERVVGLADQARSASTPPPNLQRVQGRKCEAELLTSLVEPYAHLETAVTARRRPRSWWERERAFGTCAASLASSAALPVPPDVTVVRCC